TSLVTAAPTAEAADVLRRVEELLAGHPPATTDRRAFLEAQFDAGLAWVHFPEGAGGLGLSPALQRVVDGALAKAGAPAPDPARPKHLGLTYFICDMQAPGVDVRPLRQMTGDAEFNEVYLNDVRLSDDLRLGGEGDGWRVSMTTLMNERVSIGGGRSSRG